MPTWTVHGNNTPQIFVYEGNAMIVIDNDTWRAEGIDSINNLNKEVYRR